MKNPPPHPMQLRFPIGTRIKSSPSYPPSRTRSEPWRDTEDLGRWLVLLEDGRTIDCTSAEPLCSCHECDKCKGACLALRSDITLERDPFLHELFNDGRPVWSCEPCRSARAAEI